MHRRMDNVMEWLANIWLFLWNFLFPVAVAGGIISVAVMTIQSSIAGMQFQQTHPITQARVVSIFTHTYSTYDSQTDTSSTRTETCAAHIRFRANGQEVEVDVSALLACPMQIGDQPKIAYDLQQPAHVQFVPADDPLQGNSQHILLELALAGAAVMVIFRFPSGRGFRAFRVFWMISGVFCMIALIMMNVVNRQ